MDFTRARRSVPILEPDRHAEALTLAAARLLGSGEASAAFEYADRRCRLPGKPAASDVLVRGLATLATGWTDWSTGDLARAARGDPTDRLVNLARLRFAEDEATSREAVRLLLENPSADLGAIRAAITRLTKLGDRAVAHFDLVDGRLGGRVLWAGSPSATLEVVGADGVWRHDLVDDTGSALSELLGHAAHVQVRPAIARPNAYRILVDGDVVAQGPLWPRATRRTARAAGPRVAPPLDVPKRAAIRVVIPVYDDFDATRACLASVAAETLARPDVQVVAVDDATPDPRIARLLDDMAARGQIELRRNPSNLGFIGAVERGLADAMGRDVLLLNADTVLPRGAIDRLAEAVYGAPDIGTATPFSNNGEYVSFPRHGEAHPAPDPKEAARIDAVAARVNAGRVVDLPNGVGFCLFIRHDCLKAVGGLCEVYHRGYFEDLEFCVRARRAGFRNVCATSLYVVHHGTLSFKTDKRALVLRNLRLFRRRFPEFEAECAAYVAADPLRAARAAIEAEIPPKERIRLIVAPADSAVATERTRHLRLGDTAVVLATWRAVGGRTLVSLRHRGEAPPRALDFRFEDEADALSDYLIRLVPHRIEVCGAHPPPRALVDRLTALGAPLDILAGDFDPSEGRASTETSPLIASFERWLDVLADRWDKVVTVDRLTESLLRSHLKGSPLAERLGHRPRAKTGRDARSKPSIGSSATSLGVVMPRPSPEADLFVQGLSHRLRLRSPDRRVVVLGRGVDDLALMARGNVFVTGEMSADDHHRAIVQYGIGALVLPDVSTDVALFERLLTETGLPGAAFDWSFGHFSAKTPFLLMDPRDRDRDSLAVIADWFVARLAT